MSSTRKAPQGAPISYERYMSSPEYAELRGIPGTAVAAKAQLYLSARKRSLLFFLQSMSLKDGGMRQLARDLFAEFPERIGSPKMRATAAKRYDYKTACGIAVELKIDHSELWGCDDESLDGWMNAYLGRPMPQESDFSVAYKKALRSKIDASVFIGECLRHDEELSRFLVEVCINPKLPIAFSTDEEWVSELEADAWNCSNFADAETKTPSVPYFDGIIDALAEYQDRYEARSASEFITTTISKVAVDTLNRALLTGKMAVIEGLSGSGKSTTAEAWCDAHRGQARFVTLSGITHKTGFFQKLAAVIGLASSNRKATDMQVKVEEFFRRTRLMLVIDEAHHLWPQHQRSHSNPELIDWVNTALVNQRVPVALICTDQFIKLKKRIEKQTGWTSEQLEHRVKRFVKLPEIPTEEDVEAVVARLLSREWDHVRGDWLTPATSAVNRDCVDMIVGYAMTAKQRLPTAADLVDEARLQARLSGRSVVSAIDIDRGMREQQIPSDQAMTTYAFNDDRDELDKSVTSSRRGSAATLVQTDCTDPAAADTEPLTSTPNRSGGSLRSTHRNAQELTSPVH